jgi:hypothetical protein
LLRIITKRSAPRHVEVAFRRPVAAAKERDRLPGREDGNGLDGQRHDLVAAAVEELAAGARPYRVHAAALGQEPLVSASRDAPDVVEANSTHALMLEAYWALQPRDDRLLCDVCATAPVAEQSGRSRYVHVRCACNRPCT